MNNLADSLPNKILAGHLEDFSIFDITQSLMLGRKTALVSLSMGSRKSYLFFTDGQITSALDDSLSKGEKAAFKVFTWCNGEFTIEFDASPLEPNIGIDTENLMLEVARQLDETTKDGGEAEGEDEVAQRFEDHLRNELEDAFSKVATTTVPTRERYTVNAFDSLLMALRDLDGTALFLRPDCRPRVKTRDGFRTIKQETVAADEIEGFLSSLLSQRELATYTESHQVDTYHTTERAGTFQVTVLRHAGHTACIFTPASRSIPFPSQLGGDAERATALLDQEGGGLLLVTGPMAAGKSTFLASFLEQSLREHDHLVALYARRQTFAFSEDHGFMLHSDIDRFSTGNGGSLPTAVGQGADVVAVDEIEGSAMLETAVSIARGIAFVTGVIAVDGLDELGEMVATATRNDRSGKLGRRLADCLIGVVEVDLAGRENGGVARIVLHEVDEAMRERIVRGEPRPFARPTAPA